MTFYMQFEENKKLCGANPPLQSAYLHPYKLCKKIEILYLYLGFVIRNCYWFEQSSLHKCLIVGSSSNMSSFISFRMNIWKNEINLQYLMSFKLVVRSCGNIYNQLVAWSLSAKKGNRLIKRPKSISQVTHRIISHPNVLVIEKQICTVLTS